MCQTAHVYNFVYLHILSESEYFKVGDSCITSAADIFFFFPPKMLQFAICTLPHGSELIRRLPGSTHSYLKNLSITGFAGCTGQIELLLHIVENAPNLEALTIDRVNHYGNSEEYVRQSRSKALDIARRHLDGRLSENTKVSIM